MDAASRLPIMLPPPPQCRSIACCLKQVRAQALYVFDRRRSIFRANFHTHAHLPQTRHGAKSDALTLRFLVSARISRRCRKSATKQLWMLLLPPLPQGGRVLSDWSRVAASRARSSKLPRHSLRLAASHSVSSLMPRTPIRRACSSLEQCASAYLCRLACV